MRGMWTSARRIMVRDEPGPKSSADGSADEKANDQRDNDEDQGAQQNKQHSPTDYPLPRLYRGAGDRWLSWFDNRVGHSVLKECFPQTHGNNARGATKVPRGPRDRRAARGAEGAMLWRKPPDWRKEPKRERLCRRRNVRPRRVRQMARALVPLPHTSQQRLLGAAAIERIRVADVKAAAAGRVDRTGHFAGQDHAVARRVGARCQRPDNADALALSRFPRRPPPRRLINGGEHKFGAPEGAPFLVRPAGDGADPGLGCQHQPVPAMTAREHRRPRL